MGNRYENIYSRIVQKIPSIVTDEVGTTYRLAANQFMDLVVEKLSQNGDTILISMGHYYQQNGDRMADPDMEVRLITPEGLRGMAEALTFKMDGVSGGTLFQEVYPENDAGETLVRPRLRRELNQFLDMWTNNLRRQGHALPAA